MVLKLCEANHGTLNRGHLAALALSALPREKSGALGKSRLKCLLPPIRIGAGDGNKILFLHSSEWYWMGKTALRISSEKER